jgi:hypothetical protein
MNERAEAVEVEIEEVRKSAPSDNGSGVVLETEAKVRGELHDTVIEVHQEDVPAVAVALLDTQADVAKIGTDEPPAIKVLGAGVVHWTSADAVRFHLQFDSGQVLPIEMSKDAALALCRGLFQHANGASGFTPSEWGDIAFGGTPA